MHISISVHLVLSHILFRFMVAEFLEYFFSYLNVIGIILYFYVEIHYI